MKKQERRKAPAEISEKQKQLNRSYSMQQVGQLGHAKGTSRRSTSHNPQLMSSFRRLRYSVDCDMWQNVHAREHTHTTHTSTYNNKCGNTKTTSSTLENMDKMRLTTYQWSIATHGTYADTRDERGSWSGSGFASGWAEMKLTSEKLLSKMQWHWEKASRLGTAQEMWIPNAR